MFIGVKVSRETRIGEETEKGEGDKNNSCKDRCKDKGKGNRGMVSEGKKKRNKKGTKCLQQFMIDVLY